MRAARHFAAAEAAGWGVDHQDLEVVVGELVANAYRHAGTRFTVSLCYSDQMLTVEVSDGSRGLPLPGPPLGPDEESRTLATGRGLLIVETLVSAWGTRSAPGGKIVWAELPAVELGREEAPPR